MFHGFPRVSNKAGATVLSQGFFLSTVRLCFGTASVAILSDPSAYSYRNQPTPSSRSLYDDTTRHFPLLRQDLPQFDRLFLFILISTNDSVWKTS